MARAENYQLRLCNPVLSNRLSVELHNPNVRAWRTVRFIT